MELKVINMNSDQGILVFIWVEENEYKRVNII